jgi:hypothetical protein
MSHGGTNTSNEVQVQNQSITPSIGTKANKKTTWRYSKSNKTLNTSTPRSVSKYNTKGTSMPRTGTNMLHRGTSQTCMPVKHRDVYIHTYSA